MKIAIIGSRDFNNYELLKEVMNPYRGKITRIISGGAEGADNLGAKFSREVLRREPLIFEALWDDCTVDELLMGKDKKGNYYNKLAGFNRNTTIIENCDCVIAFWDGSSSGTKDSLKKADKMKKPVKLIIYE
jgi:hypothetical protein